MTKLKRVLDFSEITNSLAWVDFFSGICLHLEHPWASPIPLLRSIIYDNPVWEIEIQASGRPHHPIQKFTTLQFCSFFALSHWARPGRPGTVFPIGPQTWHPGAAPPDPRFVDLVRTSERPPSSLKKWAQKIPESLQLFVGDFVMCADRCYVTKGVDC